MKSLEVGILSMQRVINYGSFLQAYALKQLLLESGAAKVSFIDIKNGISLKGYENKGYKYYFRRFKALLKVIACGNFFSKRRTVKFMSKVGEEIRANWQLLGLEMKPNSFPQLVVIGSDEVFHCCQATKWGFTTQLYGDIPEAKNIISYAGSFGFTTLEKIQRHGVETSIRDSLKNLSQLSVRDSNSFHIVEALLGLKPQIHFDPVLTYGYRNEILDLAPTNETNYILIYSYPDRIKDPKEIKAIIDYAKSCNKKLICIMSCYDWCDRAVACSPLEVLRWYKYADEIITETFHGSIFAIISHKPFVTIARESAKAKLNSMLEPFGLENRILDSNHDISKVFSHKIEFSEIDKILKDEHDKTISYLKKAINYTNQLCNQ